MARFLALDWDQNQLHIVSASVSGNTVDFHRAAVWEEDQPLTAENAEQMGKVLRDRLKSAGIKPAPVLACVGRDRLILKDLRFPPVPEAEEAGVVRFQAVKELTDAPDDVVLDYVPVSPVFGSSTTTSGDRRAFAVIAGREVVEMYRRLCQAAGLKLEGLSPRLIGIAACLRKAIGSTALTPPPEPADAAVAAAVISERWAEFCVLRGDNILLARSLHAGAGLAGEVRRNLAVHAGQSHQHPVAAVYVAGQGLADLRQALTDLVSVPIHPFDPFAGSESPNLPAAHRGTFAGAAGLLYARATPAGLPINLVQPRQPKPPPNPSYRLARLAVVAAIALFVGLAVLGRVLHADYQRELDSVESQERDLDAKLASARAQGKRLKALDDWDSLPYLDELYDLTARIPDVNQLRITQVTAETLKRDPENRYAAAKVTLKGKLLAGRRPLDEFVAQLNKDPYYMRPLLTVDRDEFTLTVNIERRPPGDYKAVLTPPDPKTLSKGRGGDSGRGMRGGRGGRRERSEEGEE